MKSYINICLQFILVGGLCASVTQQLDPEELIDKYGLSNKKFETIYYELETTTQYEGIRPGKRVHSIKYCSDNEKKQWIGHRRQYNENGTINQKSSSLLRDIYSDKWGVHLQFYNPEVENTRPPRAVLVRSSLDRYLQDYKAHPPYGGSFFGLLWGNNDQSVYDLLRGATNPKLHNKTSKIIGHDSYLIEADTQYGTVKAWICPEVDYNCLRWEIIKGPNQYYRDGAFVKDEFTKCTAVFQAEKIEQIDDQYIITQAGLSYIVENGDLVLSNSTYHFNLKNIDFTPDYEAMGAFKIQLPKGTVATHEEVSGIQFTWSNGNFVPDVNDYLYTNLTGRPLPNLKVFMKDLEPDYSKGKMVLICFWDMQQRSSRNLVKVLAQREKELKNKNLTVYLIDTSGVSTDELYKWLEENNISFTSGRTTGQDQKALLRWGVRARPWLILTDNNNIVISEGFSITEMDRIITTSAEK